MNEQNKYRAYFTLVGNFDPNVISGQLGIVPSRSWRKGDHNPRTGIARALSRWSLDSRIGATEYIDRHVLDVLEQLSPASESVLNLRSTYDGWIQLVAYFLNGQASISLDSNIIERLSKLRLGLDLDPYDLLASEEDS